MTLENVIKEINNVAEEKSNTIINEGKTEAQKILSQTNEKIQKSREKTIQKTSEIVSSIERTEIASLKLLMKKQSLNSKKEVIDSVFAEAKKELQKLSEKEKEKILKKLLHKAKHEVEGKYFYCNSKDKTLVAKISGLKPKGTIDCIGGFVLENEDGTIRSDQTFDLILEKVKERNISEISSKVFK